MVYDKQRMMKKILKELENVPVPYAVCQKFGIARSTYYRWLEENTEFQERVEESMEKGRNSINELAESKLIKQIGEEKKWAIKYWLSNNCKRYLTPRRPIEYHKKEKKLTTSLVQFIGGSNSKNEDKTQ